MIEDDITPQTELVMENIKAILEAADSSFDRTVNNRVFERHRHILTPWEKCTAAISAHPPARVPPRPGSPSCTAGLEIELLALA